MVYVYEKLWSDNTHIVLSEALGVKLFKKNWNIKGSFLNKKLNKNSIDDLHKVIDDANGFTEYRLQRIFSLGSLAIEASICLSSYIFYKLGMKKLSLISFFLLNAEVIGINSYSLMVHRYNRIKAKKRIEILKK